jgi:hypothetical protein
MAPHGNRFQAETAIAKQLLWNPVSGIIKWRYFMGSRDFAGKEKKKPKKDAKKQPIITNFEAPRPEVEVIRKGKKPKDLEE